MAVARQQVTGTAEAPARRPKVSLRTLHSTLMSKASRISNCRESDAYGRWRWMQSGPHLYWKLTRALLALAQNSGQMKARHLAVHG